MGMLVVVPSEVLLLFGAENDVPDVRPRGVNLAS